MDILALLQHLNPILSKTTLRQMSLIICAVLAMTGRVTMLGISRWSDKGGSYRTVQRFFQTTIPWAQVLWSFFHTQLQEPDVVYVLAGDESVISKSGQQTHGLDRFFSSLYGKPIPGIAIFALSLIDTQARRSYPVMVEQVVRSAEEKAASREKTQQRQAQQKEGQAKRKPGRPPGSKNRNKAEVCLTPELQRIQDMVKQFLLLAGQAVPLTYLVLDGHFGHNNALQMVLSTGLHLVSKLRWDSALYFDYQGTDKRRKYGDRIDYANLPAKSLKKTKTENGIRTDIYQTTARHKEFGQRLNVVIIVKTNVKTGVWGHVILFSSDLDLAWDKVIEYYRLRFQIEFNFRDAKQYWGLEDFMNIGKTPVTNAINLSLFMVNVSQRLLRDLRQEDSNVNVLDLKALYRGHKYVVETIKLLSQKPEPILLSAIFNRISGLGRIHAPQSRCSSP